MKMRKRVGSQKVPTLVLTPLLDMFTIILIFLIVTFEAEDAGFKLAPGLALPESSTRTELKPAVNMSISAAGIRVQDELAVAFKDGKPDDAHYDAGAIAPLIEALKKARKIKLQQVQLRQQLGENSDDDEATVVVVQSDKALDYRTLYLTLRSAAQAGFFKYRLAVLKQ